MIVNLTPHDVNIIDENDQCIKTFPRSLNPVRIDLETVRGILLDGIPISNAVMKICTDLPSVKKGTYYIVSRVVKNAMSHRNDLLVPAEVVRDTNGNTIGCRSLGKSSKLIKI